MCVAGIAAMKNYNYISPCIMSQQSNRTYIALGFFLLELLERLSHITGADVLNRGNSMLMLTRGDTEPIP